jgi:hypothetical protein
MPGSVRTRPSKLSVHSTLRAKALPGISGYLSIKSTHDYIFYLRRCEILSGLLWRSVLMKGTRKMVATLLLPLGCRGFPIGCHGEKRTKKLSNFDIPQHFLHNCDNDKHHLKQGVRWHARGGCGERSSPQGTDGIVAYTMIGRETQYAVSLPSHVLFYHPC